MKLVDHGEPTSFLDHVYLVCTQRECKSNESINEENRKMFESRISAGATDKSLGRERSHGNTIAWSFTRRRSLGLMTWKDTLKNVLSDTANWQTRKWSNCKKSSPCLDDHQFKQEEVEYVGELAEVCSQISLNCLYSVRIGRPDIFWSVNKLARAVTKWTGVCDRRLVRLI